MRILLLYPGHSHSTIDIAIGYENALTKLGHHVRAFNYHNQLAFYSEAWRHWLRVNPEYESIDPDQAVLLLSSEQVVIDAIDMVPDVVVIVCGFALHRRAYDLLDSLALPLALILTESPYLDEEQARIVELGHVRLAFTNDKESVIPLRETGVAIEYLPHSFDPLRHYERDVDGDYQNDLFFFGTMWPERRRLLYPLKRWARRWRPDWRVSIGGVGPMDGRAKRLIDNAELVKFYSGAGVALNHHRSISRSVDGKEIHLPGWSLGPRAYEIAACGAFQLSDGRPELREVFGDAVAVYDGGADLRRKADYYMRHDDEREDMALEALDRVQSCSFEDRAQEILIPRIEEVL